MTQPLTATMIIMTYNQEDYVADAVTSLLEQDCRPVEILISDDASTDRTWEIIQEVTRDYQGPHRVTLNKNARNLGIAQHCNKCVEIAPGEALILCGGDDISVKSRAATILDTFEREKALLVFSRVDTKRLNDVKTASTFLKEPPTLYRTHDPKDVLPSMALYVGATGAYHRDLFRKYGSLPTVDCYEDLILGFRAALEGRIVMIDQELVHYRLGGITTRGKNNLSKLQKIERKIRENKRHTIVLQQRLLDCRAAGFDTRALQDQANTLLQKNRKKRNKMIFKRRLKMITATINGFFKFKSNQTPSEVEN